MLRQLHYLAGMGVRRKLRRALAKTLSSAESCREVQRATLNRILDLNRGSALSQAWGLASACSIDEFRSRVAIDGYDAVASYIERLKRGDVQAMLGSHNRLLMFALTSGTTSACKYVPITDRFLADYRRGWHVWAIRAFDAHPLLHKRKIFQLASDFDQFRTTGNIPCGNISGLAQQMQNPIVRLRFTVPRAALKIADSAARLYFALLRSAADREVGLITTANPGTLIQVAEMLATQSETLIRDIREGTCTYPDGTQPGRPRNLRPRPDRARELEQIVRHQATLRPRDVWPDLQLLAVWTGGTAAAYLPRLRELFQGVPVRDHGLSASEGRMTIPLEDETDSGLLDIESHYFEFVPERERDSSKPVVLEAHELEIGASYDILLTTSSGLSRYDIQDVVECTGFCGTTPLLRFLHKGAHISNLAGEKLTEYQVVQAVSRSANEAGVTIACFTVAPQWGAPPRYGLFVEEGLFSSCHQATHFASRVDRNLHELNCEYAAKRDSGRLAALALETVRRGTWEQLAARHREFPGGSLEQYKHPFLIPKESFQEHVTQGTMKASVSLPDSPASTTFTSPS